MRITKNKSTSSNTQGLKNRILFIAGFLVFLSAGLLARLAYLQIIQHDQLVAQSEKQYARTVEIFTGRGNIYDRLMNPLATNVEVESVYINPQSILDKDPTARVLAAALHLDFKEVRRKIDSPKHFVWIKRKSDLDEIEKLEQLGLAGVGFITESKRFYPKRELAASTLGFVGMDNQGLAGIEHFHQDRLKGTLRRQVMEKDARGRILLTHGGKTPSRSHDVVLTLDEVIQYIAERELKHQVREYGAKSGLAVVMAPATGEIYALATTPVFNPNHYSAYPPRTWQNIAVSNAYEPGSIFKPIVVAAALEEGIAQPNDIFFCENGTFELGDAKIGEAAGHKFGWLTLEDIVVKSSNIGAIKVAQELGEKRFFSYIQKFGFGKKLGIDLPGEATGRLRGLAQWSGLSLASISFGHEISATPIQMVAAIGAIANGGNLMRPHLTRAIMKNGVLVKNYPPEKIHRVLSKNTSRQMTDILKSVVQRGTGRRAAIPGFEVAGKTGTAQKIDPETHSYSKTAFIASFIGFVPADDPKLVILVMIDEPKKSYWGGEVAAPVFRNIARQSLRYLNIPSNLERVFTLNQA